MGGLGSGIWKKRERRTVDSCQELDADELSARGFLRPGWSGVLLCTLGNEVIPIDLSAEAERLQLSWRITGIGTDGSVMYQESLIAVPIVQTISIVRVPCNLGGYRPHFLCPGDGVAGCDRLVIKLYLSGHHFLCRLCARLVYASPYEQPWQRARRRAHKLRQRLGIAGIADPLPKKPKGMLATTYARLLEAILRAEIQADEAQADQLQRLVAQIEDRSRKDRNRPLFTL